MTAHSPGSAAPARQKLVHSEGWLVLVRTVSRASPAAYRRLDPTGRHGRLHAPLRHLCAPGGVSRVPSSCPGALPYSTLQSKYSLIVC